MKQNSIPKRILIYLGLWTVFIILGFITTAPFSMASMEFPSWKDTK